MTNKLFLALMMIPVKKLWEEENFTHKKNEEKIELQIYCLCLYCQSYLNPNATIETKTKIFRYGKDFIISLPKNSIQFSITLLHNLALYQQAKF